MKTTTIKSSSLLFVSVLMATVAFNADQAIPNVKTERIKGKNINLYLSKVE